MGKKELGRGGFGIVVEGISQDQQKIAVKILNNFSIFSIAAKRQVCEKVTIKIDE
jgi:hypothetical protein